MCHNAAQSRIQAQKRASDLRVWKSAVLEQNKGLDKVGSKDARVSAMSKKRVPTVAVEVIAPRSVEQLPAWQREKLEELTAVAVRLRLVERERDELVIRLREKGVSWSALGWAVGTTGEAARQRWSVFDSRPEK